MTAAVYCRRLASQTNLLNTGRRDLLFEVEGGVSDSRHSGTMFTVFSAVR